MKLNTLLFLFSLFFANPTWAQSMCHSVFTSESGRGESAELPGFSLEQISFVKNLSRGNFEAVIDGQKVFLKKLRASSETELSWLQKINSLGLGVELFGTVKIQEQTFAVLEHFEGVNTQIPMMAPSNFILSKVAVAEIHRQAGVLAENGIIPVDLQFQVSPDGRSVKIIDPELFQQAQSPQEALQKSQSILMNILLPWTMEGKVEP